MTHTECWHERSRESHEATNRSAVRKDVMPFVFTWRKFWKFSQSKSEGSHEISLLSQVFCMIGLPCRRLIHLLDLWFLYVTRHRSWQLRKIHDRETIEESKYHCVCRWTVSSWSFFCMVERDTRCLSYSQVPLCFLERYACYGWRDTLAYNLSAHQFTDFKTLAGRQL